MKPRIGIVTPECYPFSGGGIGRLVYNLVRDALRRSDDLEIHLLVPAGLANPEQAREALGRSVQVHPMTFESGDAPRTLDGRVYPPPSAFSDCLAHSRSLDVLLTLKRLTRSGIRFDVVEFPDFQGWAYSTIQEKLLGLDFESTEIAVRIHSTDGVLQHFEPREVTHAQVALFELERKALHDADRVIAPLVPIAEFNQRYYGFEERWLEKVTVEFPPVLDAGCSPSSTRPEPADRDLLFATKIQPVKRPDLFVRGAALFLAANPEYRGRALLTCHASDDRYLERVRAMVPKALAERFAFLPVGPDRRVLFERSILVIPSVYESLSLIAYEGAGSGAVLVVNGACPAFGAGTPFQDAVNCHKFDGTPEGLAAVLERACRAPAPQPVAWSASESYWITGARRPQAGPVSVSAHPRVSVVITNYNLGRYLPATIASVEATRYPALEVIVVDDASTECSDAEVLDTLAADADPASGIRIIRNSVNRGLPGARNVGIRAATGEYILPLDGDDCIAPEFIDTAVRALDAHPDFSGIVPTTGFFESDLDLDARRFSDFAIFLGDVPSFGLVVNRLSTATAMLRRSVFDGFAYDESLTSYEDWDFYLRLALAGHRFVVTNDVQFHYRRRPGSMITNITPERHLALLARMFESLPSPLPASVRLFGLLAPTAHLLHSAAAHQPADVGAKPLRYSLVDRVNESLKRIPHLHPMLKQSAAWAKRRWGSSQS